MAQSGASSTSQNSIGVNDVWIGIRLHSYYLYIKPEVTRSLTLTQHTLNTPHVKNPSSKNQRHRIASLRLLVPVDLRRLYWRIGQPAEKLNI
jgi:hypothetical protein